MTLFKWLFGLFLVVYFVATVVANVPAQWGAALALKSAPGLSLSSVTGTLWQGKAGEAKVQIPGEVLELGSVSWKLQPMSLLALKPCADISSMNINGQACHSLSGTTELKQMLIDQVPASLFEQFVGAQLGGVGQATLSQASISKTQEIKSLQGNVSWQRARVNIGDGWQALGSFAADLSANGQGGVLAKITELEGELDVDIDAELQPNQMPKLKGSIKPSPKAPPMVVNGLSIFAQPQEDGSYLVAWPMEG